MTLRCPLGIMTASPNCYCSLWDTSPEVLRDQNVPAGFCGLCSVCGLPGHLRHAPDGPYTDAWCDRHFRWRQVRAVLFAAMMIAFVAAIAAAERCAK
jgi:hypothetical protein